MNTSIKSFLAISKALNDQTRVRILHALRHRELCLCQLVELFSLAPSTVSKHLSVLYDAGLVDRRKEGRWAYFKLAGRDAEKPIRQALRWMQGSLEDDATIAADAEALEIILEQDLETLSGCYS